VKKAALIIITLILLMTCFVLPASAFDGNDYDSGDSDSGGWDSGDSDWNDSDGGYYSSEYGLSDTAETVLGAIFFGIIVLVIVGSIAGLIGRIRRGGRKAGVPRPSSTQGGGVQLPDRTLYIEQHIKAHDPRFSASDFISFVKRMYIDIETAWMNRDLTPVRSLLHDNLYDATVQQIRAKIDQGVVYHYESMVVNTAYLTSYAKDGQFEYLTVYLNARRIDWQEDENTGKILRGDKYTRWDMRYKMKFMRSLGVLTREEISGVTGHNCPNCGAPLEMTSSTKCEYCGANVTTGQYSWVLSDYGTVRDDTVDEGIRTD